MSTAGGLVFVGAREGQFIALDARNGKALWHFNTGGSIRSSPISYAVGGKQYVAIVGKTAVFTFTLLDSRPK
jgi:alcohol dehydrogenase (cytochrome c)